MAQRSRDVIQERRQILPQLGQLPCVHELILPKETRLARSRNGVILAAVLSWPGLRLIWMPPGSKSRHEMLQRSLLSETCPRPICCSTATKFVAGFDAVLEAEGVIVKRAGLLVRCFARWLAWPAAVARIMGVWPTTGWRVLGGAVRRPRAGGPGVRAVADLARHRPPPAAKTGLTTTAADTAA